jgi:hypothetical protein
MNSNLKQQIWEAHPFTPRVNKLKLVKYIPVAVERLEDCSRLIGLSHPTSCDPAKCLIDDDMLVLRDSHGHTLGYFYVGDESRKLNMLVLSTGTSISEHEYHSIRGQLDACHCTDCQSERIATVNQKAEEQIDLFAARSIPIHTPQEMKVKDVSPGVLERISLHKTL